MAECVRNLTRDEIIMEFGKDDMDACNSCPNLEYKAGMISCKKLNGKDEKDEN